MLTFIIAFNLGFLFCAWWVGRGERVSMIELKNINLEGITITEQIRKIEEENDEFRTAVIKGDVDNAVEEFFDLMQASLGALQKMGLRADYVMKQYPKHLEKLKFRPRD